MPLSSADRIAFSGQIVTAVSQVKAIAAAQAQLQVQINMLQALDTANANLFIPSNLLINGYQSELSALDGNGRTTIVEQDIVDAANKKLQNHFFPNDVNTVVPSITSLHNVWPRLTPYALGFGIGKSYVETYTVVPKEGDDISAITTIITNAQMTYTDFELTTGTVPAVPGPGNVPSPAIDAIVASLVAAVNALITFLNNEVTLIVTTDKSSPNQANNAAAISNINTVILPALATWLALPMYEATGVGPSKLHSTQLTALTTALSNRTTFISTRISQITAVLGPLSQDITTGNVSGSGLYVTRYNFLNLRLNLLGGSLSQLAAGQASVNAQTSISQNVTQTAATYNSILPTTALAAPANGTSAVSVVDANAYSAGDTVYLVADGQPEIQRAIKSIMGKLITLNDIVPSKYTTDINVRLYKDLT